MSERTVRCLCGAVRWRMANAPCSARSSGEVRLPLVGRRGDYMLPSTLFTNVLIVVPVVS
jgi:hypothetical protein